MNNKSIRNWWARHKDYPCFYCGCVLTPENRTRDHLIPVSKGGLDRGDNVVQCCQPCNVDKGKLPFDEYLWLLEYRKTKTSA